MAIHGITLGEHLKNVVAEYSDCNSVYGYPVRKIYTGFPGLDLSVDFHDKKAATPIGPASGPHTQMAQNILLSFLCGGRTIELKTVQILDKLEIPRPCIDARNICYNVEWSQELCLSESYREYVNAWALLKIIEEMELLGVPKGAPFYDVIFDLSVGYNLEGISSPPMHKWICGMLDASKEIEKVLSELPSEFARFKDLAIPGQIANSVTVSTFHGCPKDEIEAIVKYLISEHKLHVIIKMNPTLLGYDFVEKTIRQLGYKHVELDKKAFNTDLQFGDAVSMLKRLEKFSIEHGRKMGAKFTNTLIVKNTEKVFKDEVMYLSGTPLHVLAMNTMYRVRGEMGDHFPVSFSAGVDKHNFADAVRCDLKPVTVCTDLLKGGYRQMYESLKCLKREMENSDSHDIVEFIAGSGLANATLIVPKLLQDEYYHRDNNSKTPKKSGRPLAMFDCTTCYKCLQVCPNAANFSIVTGTKQVPADDIEYQNGRFSTSPGAEFTLKKKTQIANLAEFCNQCGNCETFCPEDGGPSAIKPRFFLSQATFEKYRGNGFYFPTPFTLTGRIDGAMHSLSLSGKEYTWTFSGFEIHMGENDEFIFGKCLDKISTARISSRPYYILRTLLDGAIANSASYLTMLRGERNTT